MLLLICNSNPLQERSESVEKTIQMTHVLWSQRILCIQTQYFVFCCGEDLPFIVLLKDHQSLGIQGTFQWKPL